MTFQNYYYSGQGSLYAAPRVAGKPGGLVRVGNVPELNVDIATTVYEHKESESGDRAIDLVLDKERKSTFQFKLENLSLDNLAMGLYGTKATVNGSTVTDEEVILYATKSSSVAYPDISAVTVSAKDGVNSAAWVADTVTALGAYVHPVAPNSHYYKCTARSGDFKTAAVTEPVWPTDGTTIVDDAVTWTDMGLINRVNGTDYTLSGKFGMISPVQALALGVGIDSGRPYLVDYTYASSNKLDVFTTAAPERWLRFEGLNTVDQTRVIVDIFKARFDPLTGYSMIVEEMGSADMKGAILYDSLQVTGSKFFRQWNVSA